MKKYTLQFQDKAIEKNYCLSRIKSSEFPTLTYVTIGGSLLLATNIVVHLITENYSSALRNGIVLSYLLLQYFILKKYQDYRKHCNKALLLTNLLFLSFEIETQDLTATLYFDGYLLGSNQMLVHTIIMFSNTFAYAIASNLILMAARIIIVYYLQNPLSVSQYIYTIMISLSFLIIQYEVEKQYRISYLLTIKDNRWDVMIPQYLKKPYIIFYFNQELNQYKILHSYNVDFFQLENPLTNQIYSSKLKEYGSIQQLLIKIQSIKDQQDGECVFNEQLTIEIGQKKMLISLIACQFEKLIYTIIVDSEDPLLKLEKLKQKNQINLFQDILSQQIKPINQILSTYLEQTYHPLLNHLRITLIETYYQQIQESQLKLVIIKKLLQKCVKLFQSSKKQFYIICDDDLKIITLKHAMITFILEILKCWDKTHPCIIQVSSSSRITFQINGLEYPPKTQLFAQTRDILVDKILLCQNNIIFLLQKQPQTRFN